MNANFFLRNRKKVFDLLTNQAVAIFHSGYDQFKSADATHNFFVNRNFYYLTGINQADSILVVGKLGGEYVEYLFIDRIDPVLSKWVGAKLSKEEASSISNIDHKNILERSSFKQFLLNHVQPLRYSFHTVETIYLDLEQRNLPLYQTFALDLAKTIKNDYPAIAIQNIYREMIQLRMIKEEEEIQLIKESIATTKDAIYNVWKNHKELVKEADAEAYFSFVLNKASKKPSFGLIMASGKNATTLHYEENNQLIQDGSLLLMDVGCFTENYASDITRTFPVKGTFTPRQKEVYEVVLDVNKKCIEYLKDGISWQDFNAYAKQILAEGCKKLGLIKEDHEVNRYYYHSIGHSLGLDTHDPALAWQGIKKGMVITVEPGLYIEEEGIGIRIEDNVLVLDKNAENLSKDIIKEVEDLENFLK